MMMITMMMMMMMMSSPEVTHADVTWPWTHLFDRFTQGIVDGNHPGHEQLVDNDQIAIEPAEHLARPGDGTL